MAAYDGVEPVDTLDTAEESFHACPNVQTGTAWINAALKYAGDGMITWSDAEVIWDEVIGRLSKRY